MKYTCMAGCQANCYAHRPWYSQSPVPRPWYQQAYHNTRCHGHSLYLVLGSLSTVRGARLTVPGTRLATPGTCTRLTIPVGSLHQCQHCTWFTITGASRITILMPALYTVPADSLSQAMYTTKMNILHRKGCEREMNLLYVQKFTGGMQVTLPM